MGKRYGKDFINEAVALVRDEGLSFTAAAKQLEVAYETVRRWVEAAGAHRGGESIHEEIKRLRKENRILRKQKELLKEASVFFAKESK